MVVNGNNIMQADIKFYVIHEEVIFIAVGISMESHTCTFIYLVMHVMCLYPHLL